MAYAHYYQDLEHNYLLLSWGISGVAKECLSSPADLKNCWSLPLLFSELAGANAVTGPIRVLISALFSFISCKSV